MDPPPVIFIITPKGIITRQHMDSQFPKRKTLAQKGGAPRRKPSGAILHFARPWVLFGAQRNETGKKQAGRNL
jgi:hypothetical protein